MSLPHVAFGILSYNRAEEVIRSIETILASDYPADRLHIVVIDNDSSDGTTTRVAERFGDRVELLALPRNEGGCARNHAILHRPEPYSFIFDEDCVPERPDTIRRTIEFLEAHPEIGALTLRSINYFSGETEYHDWERVARRRLGEGVYEGIYVAGNGMCFRRDAVAGSKGYDERIFWGSEELALGFELLYHGVRIAYIPELALLHRRGPRAMPAPRVLEAEARNNIWAPILYLPLPLGLLMATTHTARRLLHARLRSGPDGFRGVLRGVRRALAGLPGILATRRPIPVARLAEHNRWFFHLLWH